ESIRWPREGHPWQTAVPGCGEKRQRIPPLAPTGADMVIGVQNHKIAALAGEIIADRQASLPTADHDCIELLLTGGVFHRKPPVLWFSSETRACAAHHWIGPFKRLSPAGLPASSQALPAAASARLSQLGDPHWGDQGPGCAATLSQHSTSLRAAFFRGRSGA